ncbi:MAG: hypothetical protein ACR2PO_00145 [Methyloligellaceae bacterium]
MASHPTFTSKNSIKFPSDQRTRHGTTPFGSHNGGSGPRAGQSDEDAGDEQRPKSLVAAIDEVAPANDDEHVASFAQNLGRSSEPGGERESVRLGAADIDNLENRIAARIGEIGSPSAARQVQLPQLDTAGKDPKVVYDPELIEILEQLNQTLDTAHAVLSDGSPAQQPSLPPPLPRPELKSRPQRSMLLSAIALSLLVGTAGLIYAYPWMVERSATESKVADAATPAVAASRTREFNETAAPETQPGVNRDNGASTTTLAAATPNAGNPSPAPITDSGPAQVPLPKVQFTVEPASGTAGEPIGLKLTVPPQVDGPETSIMIQGVPKGARLSAGQQVRDGTWILPPAQTSGLMLLLPDSASPGLLVLDVTLVTSNGSVPEARKLAVAVAQAKRAEAAPQPAPQPAPAPQARETAAPPAPAPQSRQAAVVPAPAPVQAVQPRRQPAVPPIQRTIAEGEESRLLARGGGLMRDGDIAGARLIFEHAARRGSVKAMVALAKSYDPDQLNKLGVQGIQPDLEKAINWYERASRGGDQESRVRAQALIAQARR